MAVAAAVASCSPPLLVALLLLPGVAVLLCLDLWRLCRRDPDGRDASSANGRHSVLVGNASFVWKKGPDKKPPRPLDTTLVSTTVDDPPGAAGSTAAEPVPDIAAELPYLLPADASQPAQPPSGKKLEDAGEDEDYQSPGGELPYGAPADQLKRSEATEEPYYAVPFHRVVPVHGGPTSQQPAPLPPPRRRQARVT
ncbi:hypothetical protein R5R35_001964 [Gryllus longicercus]|uniref:Uncharacterized protein n=1 Tax=Gryllus longicercus TaxID=2509291 RepID=A0AAN9W7T4_9ORTH